MRVSTNERNPNDLLLIIKLIVIRLKMQTSRAALPRVGIKDRQTSNHYGLDGLGLTCATLTIDNKMQRRELELN